MTYSTVPDGLLSQLTSEQQKHFQRLMLDVKPVSEHSTAWLAMSFAGCSRCILICCDCACAEQGKLRLLYRGSKHGFTADAFWQRCDGKANTLTIVKVSRSLRSAQAAASTLGPCAHSPRCSPSACAQVKQSSNVFAAFTPVAWTADSPGSITDPSRRTCIVSLINAHGRPCRLQLKAGLWT